MRILNEKEIKELDSFTDWICMCCHLHISSDSPELDMSKWSVVKPTLGKRNSGMSLFSKSNAARLKKIMEVDDNKNKITKDNKHQEHENMNYDTQKSDLIIDKATPSKSPSPDKVIIKSSSNSTSKKVKEMPEKEADKKEIEIPPVIAEPSSPEDLPYLDDFDDGSSSEGEIEKEEEKEKEEEEKEKVWGHDDDNDDDCNLIMSLPQQRFSKSGKFCKEIEMDDFDISSPKKKRSQIKKVKQAPLSPPVKISNTKNVKKNAKAKGKSAVELSSSPPADVLPPVNTAVDEVYYFSQYVQVSRYHPYCIVLYFIVLPM